MHGTSICLTAKITEMFMFMKSQIKWYHVWGFYHLTPPYFEDTIDDVIYALNCYSKQQMGIPEHIVQMKKNKY
jgi:hypothetical protein